ncbi:MAG: hypothetical protein HN584_12650 [Akkermansiaceae bacterium]|nr:hypothetical protein [Akkermansiaceae bacterium]
MKTGRWPSSCYPALTHGYYQQNQEAAEDPIARREEAVFGTRKNWPGECEGVAASPVGKACRSR